MNRLTKKSADSGMVWFIDYENNGIVLEPCEMYSHHSRLAIQKLAEYEELGTVAECKNAMARIKPKKVVSEVTKVYKCPNCESTDIFKYCGQCGCEIDWSEED